MRASNASIGNYERGDAIYLDLHPRVQLPESRERLVDEALSFTLRKIGVHC
jgi:hypothetical protein